MKIQAVSASFSFRREVCTGLLLSLFFLWAFLVFNPVFHGPDAPLYFSYAESIVRDGDLNIVDNGVPNIKPGELVPVTRTGYFPDYHNHAGAPFWTAAYLWGRAAWDAAAGAGLARFAQGRALGLSLSFFSMSSGFLAVVFVFFFARRFFFSDMVSMVSLFMIVFATPYFFFMVSEPHNGQILASLLAVVCVWFTAYMPSMRRLDIFLFGLFFAMCVAIKIDLWFLSVFILAYWVVLFRDARRPWSDWLFGGLGFILPLGLKLANDFVRYGVFRQGESALLNFRSFYFFEQIFSSYRGFFYTSPVFYLCTAGFVFLCVELFRNRKTKSENVEPGLLLKEKFMFCLTLSLFAKLFILSFRYAWGGGTPGARILLSEFVLFVLLLGKFLERVKTVPARIVTGALCFFVLFWNVLVIGEYVSGVDVGYIEHVPKLVDRLWVLDAMLAPLLIAKGMGMKLLIVGLPALGIFLGLWCFVLKPRPVISISPFGTIWAGRVPAGFLWAGSVMVCLYLFVSGLNIYAGPENVKRLREQGFYERTRLLERSQFENAENIGSIDEMIVFYVMRSNWQRVNKLRALRNAYMEPQNK